MVNKKLASSRTRLDVDKRREELLALGRKLFGKYTYDELSISDIARLAGVSKGLLYHYFPTKREFYIETVRDTAAEMIKLTQTDPHEAPTTRMKKGLRAYLDYAEENASAFLSVFRGGVGVDPEVMRIIESARHTFLDRMLEGLGKPTPSQRLAMIGWIGFAEAIILDWLATHSVSRAEIEKLLQRQFTLILGTTGLASTALKGALRELIG